ncbi:MAG: 6-phosphofructokinase [Sphingobacteriia bacterium]
MQELKRIGVFTSGGDSPGMNACIRAVVRTAHHHQLKVTGIYRGFDGMIQGNMLDMGRQDVSNIIQRGGTILKTARSEGFRTPEGRRQAYHQLQKAGIQALVAIGGDGTYRASQVFMEEYPDIRIMGCPGTIDNDLYGTDFTIGYDTAINTAMQAIDKIRDTADATDRLFFVEVMGRDAGLIALRTGLGSGAEAVLIPEIEQDLDRLYDLLERDWKRQKSSMIVVVAEGDEAGGAFAVAEQVRQRFPQYDTRVTVLGHIQRGGSPSCMDRILASRLGAAAVQALVAGMAGYACGVQYKSVVHIPFSEAVKHNIEINPQLVELVEILSA